VAETTVREALDFALGEAARQLARLERAKDSLDSRASHVIGLLGVTMMILVGSASGYFGTDPARALQADHPAAFRLAVIDTALSAGALVFALVLSVLVLMPANLEIGVRIGELYASVRGLGFNLSEVKEGFLESLDGSLSRNTMTHFRNVLLFRSGTVLSVSALLLASCIAFVLVFVPQASQDQSGLLLVSLTGFTSAILALSVLTIAVLWTRYRRALREHRSKVGALRNAHEHERGLGGME